MHTKNTEDRIIFIQNIWLTVHVSAHNLFPTPILSKMFYIHLQFKTNLSFYVFNQTYKELTNLQICIFSMHMFPSFYIYMK